jgi:hypothetical protein
MLTKEYINVTLYGSEENEPLHPRQSALTPSPLRDRSVKKYPEDATDLSMSRRIPGETAGLAADD